ncbi:MAG: VWA domain-containing protein [Acidobacteriota bacterium]
MKFCHRQSNNQILVAALWLISVVLMVSGQSVRAQPPQNLKEREVMLAISVTSDRGVPVKGLNRDHFKVTGDKKPLEITTFSDRDEPISIAFLIDTSGSMRGPVREGNLLRLVVGGIVNFMQSSNDANEYAILSFDKEARLAMDWTKDRGKTAESLAGIAAQPAQSYTSLYDACRQGLDLTRRGSHRKRIIILLTDGQDTTSKDVRFGKLKQEIRASDATFYTINIGFLSGGMFDLQGSDVTDDLAKQTGGLSFIPKNHFDVDAAFELLALLLRNQYLVGFKTFQAATDDKWHPIKIEIKLPPTAPSELKYPVLSYRTGYFDRTVRD